MEYRDLPEAVRKHYPWPGKFMPVGEAGHRMHYLDEGRGQTLLMVHGNPTWSFYYRTLVKDLSASYRCIVPDHIGCGLSDKPQDWTYRLEDHIHNLSQLIEALDLHDITLIVHDWGGAIGFGAALKHPERIKRIVVFNTAVFLGPVPAEIRLCRWPVIGPVLIRGLNGFIRAGLVRASGHRERLQDGVGTGYLAPYGSWADRVAHLRFVQDIPLEEDHPTRKIIQELDQRVTELGHLPMMLVWGEKDFCFTMDFLARFREKFPAAEVHTFPDAAHFVVEDAHERIVPLIRTFLDAHPLS